MLSTLTPRAAAFLLLTAKRNVEARLAGDYEGHPFHGNQWTSGLFTREDNGQTYHSIKHDATGAEVAAQVHADRLVLDHVSVPESAQRAGLGKTLVNQMREYAKSEGKPLETSGRATEEGKYLFESFVKRGEAEKVREQVSKERKVGWRTLPAKFKTSYKFRPLAARSAGDYEGHPFHGNQWTDVGGDVSVKAEREKQATLAATQTNLLARPKDGVVFGLNRDGQATLNYVAAYGREFQAAPLPSDVARGTPKECYKNASLLVLERPDFTYVEGFAKSDKTGDLTFMHAWAVDRAGNVVDPTWDRPENGKYFGVKYERAAYLKYLYTAKIYGVLGSTTKNVQRALDTGMPKMRALGGVGSGNFGHVGRPGEVGGSGPGGEKPMLGRPTTDYVPSRPDGLDTRERFSDGRGNYTPERSRLHDEIVAKYMKGTAAVNKPTATILGGAPGVGKSTAVNREGIGKENTVIINPDEIRNDLPEYAADANGRRPASTAFTHEEASDISAKLVKEASKGQRNIVLDGTGDSSIEKLGGKVAVLRSRGASIEAVYVTTSVEEAQRRADVRGARIGRMVPPTAMREMHRAVSKVFPEAVRQGLFDKARVYDSTNGHTLVASAKGRQLTIHSQKLWDNFIAKGK